jgi:hypothetical protein
MSWDWKLEVQIDHVLETASSYWIFVHVGWYHPWSCGLYQWLGSNNGQQDVFGFTVGRALSCEFRDPYTLTTLYVSLVRPKLECASCVWLPFYGAHIGRIERVQRNFVRYALRGLRWTDMCNLPPYVDRCALIRLETLAERRVNACDMFIFDIWSGGVNSLNLLSLISINAPWSSGGLIFIAPTTAFTSLWMMLFEAFMSSLVCSTLIYQGINFSII